MVKKESVIEKMKEDYKKLQNNYSLPDFDKLNLDFSIEKVADSETDFLIREIGRIMSEKFSNYLRFVEIIINPVSSPMFIFSIIKNLGEDEKRKLSQLYKELSKIELEIIEIDINFSEEKQAKFIKSSYISWMNIKKDLLEFIEKAKLGSSNKFENNKNGYFG